MSNYSSIKFHAHISSTVGKIRDWLLLNCAFIISNVTQSTVLQFLQNFLKNNIFGFSVVFSRKIVQISIFKVEYLENGLADFNDFGLILQDFERLFRCNQLVLALQFSFNGAFVLCNCSPNVQLADCTNIFACLTLYSVLHLVLR